MSRNGKFQSFSLSKSQRPFHKGTNYDIVQFMQFDVNLLEILLHFPNDISPIQCSEK